jgi:predicted regulator of Ras-like GTPase activity (Roadblock/LC7/MglB family)
MPFQRILYDLLAATDGAMGAVFLDYEGETVEALSYEHVEPDELRAFGAYQGIFLDRLRKIARNAECGKPQRFTIAYENAKVLSLDVQDGYYVVVLIHAEASEGLAWHHLEDCRTRLIAEM